MASSPQLATLPRPAPPTATVDIVVPAYDEERVLEASILRLRSYLDHRFPFPATITIADNASTDRTWEIASRLAAQHAGVRAVHLDQKGRGRALRAVWSASDATVVAYMDVDLATDLDALLPLVAPLVSGHSDVAIGSRLAHGARVERGTKREVISRLYNLTIRATLRNGFTDAQCGFKAVRADAARTLIPLVDDDNWFFDTELLVLAEHNGMRIHEVPVDWVDDPDSTVDVVSTALGDLKGLFRVGRRLASGGGRAAMPAGDPSRGRRSSGALSRFATIGGVSTVAYLVLLLVLRPSLGLLAANAIGLTSATLANFAAHRRYTLPDRASSESRGAFTNEVLLVFAAGLVLSSLALAVTTAVTGSVLADLVVALAVNAVVSVARFVSFRARMLRHRCDRQTAAPAVDCADERSAS